MKAKIGLYSIGLQKYWEQFEGLRERLVGYNRFISEKMSEFDCEVFNFGLVDCEERARAAGEFFNGNNVDMIFLHCATYATSAAVVPAHRICKVPVVILNLQPSVAVNYEKTTTGEWLAHCNACAAPEVANALNRFEIPYRTVSGLLGLEQSPAISVADECTSERPEAVRAWSEIGEWIRAAGVVRALRYSRFGFLGNNYSGMLDLYSDFTMLQAQTGIHIEILEMCDLHACLEEVTDADVALQMKKMKEMFRISGDSPSDPLAKKPSEEQLLWSARVAAAQYKMVERYRLDALAYYYHGTEGKEYERLQSGFIVGHSLLTAEHVPCAGEGDLKTAVAMKICDLLGTGGSFCEPVTTDYLDGTCLVGHDGPFHIKISDGKPILRGMGLYHGKKGSGVSVEAKVRKGDVTTLGLTQTFDGRLKFIVSEGVATDGKIMAIGNTQTPVRFRYDPDTYMEKWFAEAPTHHFALSVGKNAELFRKVADLMGIKIVVL